MASNPFQFPDTSNFPDPSTIQLPPPGITTTAAIRQPLVFIILYTALAAPLIVLLILLIISPVPAKTWAYRLNMIILILGLALAACNDAAEIVGMFNPLRLNINLLVATAAFNQLVPLIADCVLLLRVAAVYPPRTISTGVRALLLGIPIMLKVGRLICIALFANFFVQKGKELGPLLVLKALIPSPYMYAEAILQACDNGFCSILFLYKLNQQQNLLRPRHTSKKNIAPESTFLRIRRLFIAALSSFILPCLMNFIILIVSPLRPYDEPITIVIAVNAYVTIYSLLFATVWVPTGDPLATGTAHLGSGGTVSAEGHLRDRCTYCSSAATRRLSKSVHVNREDVETLAFGISKSPTIASRYAQSAETGALGSNGNKLEMRRIPRKSVVGGLRIDDGYDADRAEKERDFADKMHSHHGNNLVDPTEAVDEERATWSLSSTAADDSPPSGSGMLSPSSTLEGSSTGGMNGIRGGASPALRPMDSGNSTASIIHPSSNHQRYQPPLTPASQRASGLPREGVRIHIERQSYTDS